MIHTHTHTLAYIHSPNLVINHQQQVHHGTSLIIVALLPATDSVKQYLSNTKPGQISATCSVSPIIFRCVSLLLVLCTSIFFAQGS